jgi:hypothetical protein
VPQQRQGKQTCVEQGRGIVAGEALRTLTRPNDNQPSWTPDKALGQGFSVKVLPVLSTRSVNSNH